MAFTEQEWISKRAYAIWEEEGHPDGRDHDHWLQATSEYSLLTETAARKPVKARKAAPKATPAVVETSSVAEKVAKKPRAPRKPAAAKT